MTKHKKTLHIIEPDRQLRPFPADYHRAARNRSDSMTDKHETQIIKRIHKRSTALERSVRKLLEGLNIFDGTNLTLISDVDQDK